VSFRLFSSLSTQMHEMIKKEVEGMTRVDCLPARVKLSFLLDTFFSFLVLFASGASYL
jgi:hypothetical protein